MIEGIKRYGKKVFVPKYSMQQYYENPYDPDFDYDNDSDFDYVAFHGMTAKEWVETDDFKSTQTEDGYSCYGIPLHYFYSEEEKQAFEENFVEDVYFEETEETIKYRYAITELPQDNAWINGMEFGSLQEVIEAIEVGEAAYLRKLNFDAQEEIEQLEDTVTDLQLAIVELYEGSI